MSHQSVENQLGDKTIMDQWEENHENSPPTSQQSASPEVPTASTLDLLEDLWSTEKVLQKNLKLILGAVQKQLLKRRRDVDLHVAGVQLKKDLISIMDKLCNVEQIGQICSFDNFYKLLQEQKLYMIYMKDYMTEEIYTEWLAACRAHMQVPSFSSENTAGTSTSFTTVTTNDNSVDVQKLHNSGGGLAGLFGRQTMTSATGLISQTISKPENGKLFTLKSPGETGYQVIRLDVYDVNNVSDKDKRQWWKHANIRTQFLTSSPADKKMKLLQQLLDMAANDMVKIPGVKREVKDITYWSG